MATALSMELVIDAANHRVLFAEVTKGAVDYLHSLLASPDMSIAFENATAGGCVGNLYDSVELLDDAARATGVLVPPPAPPSSAGQQPAKRFFECGDKLGANCARYVADARGASCPSCGRKMKAEVLPQLSSPGAGCSGGNAAAAATGGGGEADMSVMCLLRDDLTVMPVPASELSLARSMALYVLSGAVSFAALQRRTVQLGVSIVKLTFDDLLQGLAILEASLQSRTVLTDVFLGDNKALRSCMESIQNMEIK
ncbi:hypothetical protein EJB05_31527, partial [Eragrostis curvula]